jgi:Glycosyltransferase family 87
MKAIPHYIPTLAIAITAGLVGFGMPSWLSVASPDFALKSDVRVNYAPAYMLRSGQRKLIYDFAAIRRTEAQIVAPDDNAQPFLHPAYEAAVFIPFSFLPYREAYLAWIAINFLVLIWIYILLRPYIEGLFMHGLRWIPLGLLIGFLPIAITILEGQDSLLLLLVAILSYRHLETNERRAGMLLSVGMFRFQVLLPIVALFLVWRRWKFLTGWFVGSAVCGLLSALLTGLQAQIQYFKLLQATSRLSLWLFLRRMPNLRALFLAWGLGVSATVIVSICLFLLVAYLGVKRSGEEQFLLAVSLSAIIPWYLFMHDVSILALPLFLALARAAGRREWLQAAQFMAVLVGFSGFWFAQHSFYLGVLLTLFFLAKQGIDLIRPPVCEPQTVT